jgi:hypothetical protein
MSALTNSGSSADANNINPPCTADSSANSLIIECLPTKRDEPFAEVIKMSPFFAKGIFTADGSTKTSSFEKTKVSSLMFEERSTLIPDSLTFSGL